MPRRPRYEFQFADEDFQTKMTAAHCRAARAWLGWSQSDLSKRSGVGLTGIRDFESENRRTHNTVRLLLQSTFAKSGVWCVDQGIFQEPKDIGPDHGMMPEEEDIAPSRSHS